MKFLFTSCASLIPFSEEAMYTHKYHYFNYAGDVAPHWDYVGSDGKEARIYVEGGWVWKSP